MRPTEVKNTILALTSNPEQLLKLRKKLQDYGVRLQAIAATPEKDPDTVYKYQLLAELLDKRIIDVDAWEREFAKYSWYDNKVFINAVKVVTAYNTGDLTGIHGGKGLS